MDDNQLLPPGIEQSLAGGAVVLTGNQRAARTLRHAYDTHQRDRGREVWEPPIVLSWESWLTGLWNRLVVGGYTSAVLLSTFQEHAIWCDLIAADASTSSIRPAASLADIAAKAFSLLNAFNARTRFRQYSGNSDTRAFARWLTEFERRCAHREYITRAQLPEAIGKAISAGEVALREKLLLVGFDSQTPAQSALLDVLHNAGIEIASAEDERTALKSVLIAARDEHEEVIACARWIRGRLEQQPKARIAVIVPALETYRAEIDRVFRNVLAPELNDISAVPNTGPYEFSLGFPLASSPIIATALDLLRWAAQPLPVSRISTLLLSRYFAGTDAEDAEHLARSDFDAFVLRRKSFLQPQLTIEGFSDLLSMSKAREAVPTLYKHLRAIRSMLHNRDLLAGERAHADWVTIFTDLLQAAGWAPTAMLDSAEYQTRRKWESALDELAALDFDDRRLSFHSALESLQHIASETLFAPESRQAPVQIMGPLEAAGSMFDAVWFLHAGDLAWPTTSSPNPLLPWALQRDRHMPGADLQSDFDLARRITRRIECSAPVALFSYAQTSSEGHQRPSAALADIKPQQHASSGIALSADSEPIALERLAERSPIPPPPTAVVHGGSSVLQLQAACAFRAFAEKRLFSSSLDFSDLGLDPAERGIMVHKVLEDFWREVRSQAALKQMSREEREELLDAAIMRALEKHAREADPAWGASYLATEHQRLLNLLHRWLEYEAEERSPFVVKSLEESRKRAEIGPLHLEIRIDRIDETVPGSGAGVEELRQRQILLDYKTGLAQTAEWLGDRPDEPQLPLYALLSGESTLAAVAFANIRAGTRMGLNGFEARPGILPKAATLEVGSLEEQVQQWREVLTTLAENFHAGDASVSPKLYPATCRYCEQRLLCRLNVDALASDAVDVEGDEEVVSERTEADFG